MDPVAWTRDDVAAFVRGRLVVLYSEDFLPIPTPQWIVDDSLGPVTVISTDTPAVQASTHPDDRRHLLRTFYQAAHQPGAPTQLASRMRIQDSWLTTTTHFVNLLSHPDVRGILVAAEPGTAAEAAEVDLPNEGEHDARPWMMGRLNVKSEVLEVEGRVAPLTGRSPEEIVGHPVMNLFHPDSCQDSVALWWDLIGTAGATATSRRCFLHPDGTEVWAECTYLNRLQDEGKHDVLWIAHDITDRRAQEQDLSESHEEVRRLADERQALADDFRLLADEVPAAVFRCDPDGTVTFHNTRWTELIPAMASERIHDVVSPVDRVRLDEALTRLATSGQAERLTLEVRAGGTVERVLAIALRSDGGHPVRIVGSIADVTSTVRLRREARHDELTGLLNRRGLEERLTEALATDPAGTLLVFFDLDGFKAINDSHGHDAGDLVLQELGHRLARAVRPTDTVSRFGGDEFVLVCTDVVDDGTDDGTEAIVERLQLVLSAPILFSGGVWQPSASIGTARAVPGDDPGTIIRRADLAMFDAKRSRGDQERPTHQQR